MKDVYIPYMKGSNIDWYDIALGPVTLQTSWMK